MNVKSRQFIKTLRGVFDLKEFIKKHVLGLVIVASIVLIAAFLLFLFHRVGDDVYITNISGSVSVGTTDDLHNLVMAQPGMKLAKNNIIVTGDKSSCVLSYEKKSTDKDNFVNISENSQVMLYDKNSQGGYKFFVTYGSVICNMTSNKSYKTNISTKLFNLFVDGTITKVDYDNEISIGRVYTFDGNPMIQTIQPSGTTNVAQKLLKNSVCAVKSMSDGTVGFGALNVGFELNSFTAQDLKTMSGIANMWSEKISYGSNEFEQAFQTAADYAKWTATEPVVISVTTSTDTTTVPLEVLIDETFIESDVMSTDDEYYTKTASDVLDYNDNDSEYYTISSNGSLYDSDNGNSFSIYADTSISVPFTAFTRQTVSEINNEVITTTAPTTETVTAVPETTVPDTTKRNTDTGTSRYVKNDETTRKTGTTTSDKGRETSSVSSRYTSTTPRYTTTAPTTTAPIVTVDPNTLYTVIFEYDAGIKEYWSIQVVKYGESAIAPDAPHIPGKRFVRWDRDFSKVTSNMVITAVFVDDNSADNTGTVTVASADEYCTVKFYVDSKLWKTVSVKRGETVSVSDTPVSSNASLEFYGWSDSLSNIQSDKTVFALFRSDKS